MDPATTATLVALGKRLLGAIFGPDEIDLVINQVEQGSVVAWWRLKAIAGPLFPQPGHTEQRALTAAEKVGLAAALGTDALKAGSVTSGVGAGPAVLALWALARAYSAGLGRRLDDQADSVLVQQVKAAAPFAAGGLVVAGLVVWAAIALLRRKGEVRE
jgi:hypothetical protein